MAIYVDKRRMLVIGLSALLIVVLVLALVFGCTACDTDSSGNKKKSYQKKFYFFLTQPKLEAMFEEWMADKLEEEAERLRLEEEQRLLDEAERARLEAERLEAERLAAEARRRATNNSGSSNNNQQYRSTESNANNPFVGIWANENQAIVFRFRDGGNLEVLNYTLVDEMVDVKFVTNRALAEGGYNTFSNPASFESTYKGSGTYTVNKDSVTFVLNMTNPQGTTKNVRHTTKFTMNNNRDQLQLARGLARKYVINRNTQAEVEDKRSDFVNRFTRR